MPHFKIKLITILILVVGFLSNVKGQTPQVLEEALKKEFPENSTKDGRWVFYSDKVNIEKVEKPLVKAVIPSYNFYKITLTNYLGYHINQGICIVLFDSLKSKIVLIPPMWYGGISDPFIKLFFKKQFDNKTALLNFLEEMNELMEIGSGYKFVNTGATNDLITYDLVYFKGDSYTTNGSGTSSTINYTKDGIWRQIEIKIKNLKLIEYTSINPALKDSPQYKNNYREVIK